MPKCEHCGDGIGNALYGLRLINHCSYPCVVATRNKRIKELLDEMKIKDELLAALLEGSERVSKKLDELKGE